MTVLFLSVNTKELLMRAAYVQAWKDSGKRKKKPPALPAAFLHLELIIA